MRGLMILVLLVAVSLPTGVSAQMIDLMRAGVWSAFMGRTISGTRICGVDASDGGAGANRRSFAIRHFQDNNYLTVQIFKPSWDIPQGSRISFELLFDGRYPYNGKGAGEGNRLEWTIMRDITAEFLTRFTAGNSIQVRFPDGNEPPMTLSLSGTTAVMHAFSRCIATHTGVSGVPGGAATQPFSPR